jgi:hypothetical protein
MLKHKKYANSYAIIFARVCKGPRVYKKYDPSGGNLLHIWANKCPARASFLFSHIGVTPPNFRSVGHISMRGAKLSAEGEPGKLK